MIRISVEVREPGSKRGVDLPAEGRLTPGSISLRVVRLGKSSGCAMVKLEQATESLFTHSLTVAAFGFGLNQPISNSLVWSLMMVVLGIFRDHLAEIVHTLSVMTIAPPTS